MMPAARNDFLFLDDNGRIALRTHLTTSNFTLFQGVSEVGEFPLNL